MRTALCGSAPDCIVDADCDDGLFCNGREGCSAGACVPRSGPCTFDERCDEATDICQPINPGAWVPPIGIPEPPFGIRETAPDVPSPWNVATPGFYYVDQYDPGATDSSNTYGTPARPRVSIPNTLPAGAVVEVHGLYAVAHSSPRMIGGDGSPQSPIFIRGTSMDDRPSIVQTWEIQGHYMILENLAFADADGDLSGGTVGRPIILAPAHHVVLRHSDISGNLYAGGVGVVSYDEQTTHDIVIWDNLVHDNGNWQAAYDQDRNGIAVGYRASYVWILDNVVYRSSGDGVNINATVWGDLSIGQTTHHIYVGRNTSYQNKQNGFWTKKAWDVIFSHNVSFHHVPSGSSPGAGMGYQYGPERVWFLYNEVYDCTIGIVAASDAGGYDGQYSYFVGNVIHDITNNAFDTWGARQHMYFINNTISNVGAGVHAANPPSFAMYNNVIANVSNGRHVFIEADVAPRADLQNSLLFQEGGTVSITWGNASYSTLASFQHATGDGQGCVEGDPLFVNAQAADLHLESDSPAVDSGAEHGIYNGFLTLYGIDIAVDFDGKPRPQIDMGAYER